MNAQPESGADGAQYRGLRLGRILLLVLALLAMGTGVLGVLRFDGGAAVVWPRPYDPAEPLDIYNVPGVTPQQEGRAAELIKGTLAAAHRFEDIDDALAAGWYSIEDDMTGVEHLLNPDKFLDEHFLDPEHPEALMYTSVGDERVLAAFMFVARPEQSVDDPALTGYAGALMDWHRHEHVCSTRVPGIPVAKVLGNKDENGNCMIPGATDEFGIIVDGKVYDTGAFAMVHVWVISHVCGPFAGIDGRVARTDTCEH